MLPYQQQQSRGQTIDYRMPPPPSPHYPSPNHQPMPMPVGMGPPPATHHPAHPQYPQRPHPQQSPPQQSPPQQSPPQQSPPQQPYPQQPYPQQPHQQQPYPQQPHQQQPYPQQPHQQQQPYPQQAPMPMPVGHHQMGPPPLQHQYNQHQPPRAMPVGHHPMGPPPLQQAPSRLDLHAMPSVAQVVNQEIEAYRDSDKLQFTAPASLPPLVTTLESQKLNLSLQDAGCARPCHMRSTIYQVPTSKDILDASAIEFGVLVKPFDDGEIDGKFYVPLSSSEIVRCNRCKAYANPFSRNGQCCICNYTTQIPQELDQRPELHLGSYEIRVTPEYYRNGIAETRRPHIIFAIEMTVNSRHLVDYISKNLAKVIKDYMPTDFLYSASLSPLVGFVTYNSKITLYDVQNGGHAYVVSDMTSVTSCASTSKFLVDPFEHFEVIEKFLTSLPELCAEQLEHEQQTVLGPVIDVTLKTCQLDTSNYFQKPNPKVIPTGKMYFFHSSLPVSGNDSTPGRLSTKRNIDEMKRHLGTDTESKVLAPDGKYYTQLAERCVNDYATGIELFLFPPNPREYLNIATINDLARLTGTGIINKYHVNSLNNFIEDLKISLKSTVGFDAQMRVRTSTGVSPVKYIGNFNNTIGSNIEMATVNTSSNFIVQMKYDDKIPENDLIIVQFAMIYTSICGERRVRVHNLALTPCQTLADLYKSACCDTLMNVLIRDSIDKMRTANLAPKAAKEQLTSRVISILAAYRNHCTENQTNTAQLILPEGLKLMPVYLCGALKCDAIDGGPELFPDDKILAQINLLGALPSISQVTVYPRMYTIEACEANDETNEYGLTAVLTRCFYLAIEEGKGQCYILENGHYLFIYFPNSELGQSFLSSVFGVRKDEPILAWDNRQMESNETKFLEELIKTIVFERKRTLTISVVRQGKDKLENVFRTFLYEDKKRPDVGLGVSKLDNVSYVDILCYLHTEIRSKISPKG